MKAAQISEYGDASTVTIAEIEKPTLQSGMVLVKVAAASLNPFDTKLREGYMKDFIPLQFPVTLGGDIAGVVEAVGEGVTGFAVGDKVYGNAYAVAGNSGAWAEYALVKPGGIAKMPTGLSFAEAASLVLVGVSALQGLRELMKLQAGQKILIQGGSGGIGLAAVEIAKHLGAHVATTVSPNAIELVKNLGADEVIDYKSQDVTQALHDFDALFDTTGNDMTAAFTVLKQGGTAVSMMGAGDEAAAKEKGITAIGESTQVNTERLNQLSELIEAGVVKPHIAQTFPLDQVVAAQSARETGGTIGKTVLEIA